VIAVDRLTLPLPLFFDIFTLTLPQGGALVQGCKIGTF